MTTNFQGNATISYGGTMKPGFGLTQKLTGTAKSFIFTSYDNSSDFKQHKKKTFHIRRLMKRPSHKVAKPKYKSDNGDVQYEGDVNPLTMEDNFSKFDTPWLAVLRDRNHSAQTAATSKRKKLLANTIPQPPSFYEDDMGKWEQKFKKTVQERDEFKKKYLKDTELGLTRDPNDKIMEKIEKRRKSRLSTNNFNVVDFDYHGNTNSFSHLIKNKFKDSPTVSQLNFECRLRTYKSKTEYKHKHNWINSYSKHQVNIPKTSEGRPPVPYFKKSKQQKGRENENSDKYREANANNMTHLHYFDLAQT